VRVLVIVMAVAVLVSLPCLVVAALSYDQVIDRTRSRFRRRFDGSRRCGLSWRQRRGLVRLDRTLPAATPETGPVGPPIEQVAADLRRLGRQRTGVATRSPIWFAAVQGLRRAALPRVPGAGHRAAPVRAEGPRPGDRAGTRGGRPGSRRPAPARRGSPPPISASVVVAPACRRVRLSGRFTRVRRGLGRTLPRAAGSSCSSVRADLRRRGAPRPRFLNVRVHNNVKHSERQQGRRATTGAQSVRVRLWLP